MAYVSATPRIETGFVPSWISAAIEDVKLLLARRSAYRRTFDELSAMSERELADIGLSSLMIREIAREAAKRV